MVLIYLKKCSPKITTYFTAKPKGKVTGLELSLNLDNIIKGNAIEPEVESHKRRSRVFRSLPIYIVSQAQFKAAAERHTRRTRQLV
jgi:hypothetical protein